ncbi:MAG: hypothetical protein Q9224_006602 [Gallowayella concinna]
MNRLHERTEPEAEAPDVPPSSTPETAKILIPGLEAVTMTMKEEKKYGRRFCTNLSEEEWKKSIPLWRDWGLMSPVWLWNLVKKSMSPTRQPSFVEGTAKVFFPGFSATVVPLEEEKHILELLNPDPPKKLATARLSDLPFWRITTINTDAWQALRLSSNKWEGFGVKDPPRSVVGDDNITTTTRMVIYIDFGSRWLRFPKQWEGETAPAAEDAREDGEVLLPAEAVPSILIQDENPRDTTDTSTYDNTKDGVDDTTDEAEKYLRVPSPAELR